MRAVVALFLAASIAQCNRSRPATPLEDTTLRIGFPEVGSVDALNGTRQLFQILSREGLVRIGEDGRPVPSLADSWTIAPDGLSINVRLRRNVKFHDGSPVDAVTVVEALNRVLPEFMGPAFEDVEKIIPTSETAFDLRFRRRSPFLLEGLEAAIQKPGSTGAGTGPFVALTPNEMRANRDYYLGQPTINRIVVNTYPDVRSAWADTLRGRIDMLYEVGLDALDSLTSSKNVAVFTYVRHYQYVLIFNTQAQVLRPVEIRRALNGAINRDALVQDAFDGRALPSSGLIWPSHWAFQGDLLTFAFNPGYAAEVLSKSRVPVRFKTLVRPDLGRLALVVKRQLEAVGAEMVVEEASFEQIVQTIEKRDFDAVLLELISGPSLFRPYMVWRSGGFGRPNNLAGTRLDAAFDRIRYATDDGEYRDAVALLQKATVDDPPGIFLAWGERARAVNRRFDVVTEPGRDILTTLRLWRPTNDLQYVGRN